MLERTCLSNIVCKGDNRQLLLGHDSKIRMQNLDVLTGLDDLALPLHPHNLRASQQPVAADANANANDDQDDEDDDSDFVPGHCDDSDDEDDSDYDEENDSDEEIDPLRPLKLDSIFLEKLRFRQVKPDIQRKIVCAALAGMMKTAVECRLQPKSRDDADTIILEAAELLKKQQRLVNDKDS